MHKFLFFNHFIKCLYMFRALCAHNQEVKIVLCIIWNQHTLQLADLCTGILSSCARDGHLQGVVIPYAV
jgi:hypothetical protein